MKLRRLGNRGDTIVEVLIATTIASLILGGAYALTNHTLANSRQAQEHAEALHLASQQIETIRSFQQDTSSPNFQTLTGSGNHCIVAGTVETRLSCPAVESSVDYVPTITYNQTNKYFKVRVVWDGATGSAIKDSVELVYRIEQT